uniref:DUF1569 domain-containing protein n=1 Tax=Acidobacterium capsulatum TaxID=33075 RepID=A0A7V5CSE9_9BACT
MLVGMKRLTTPGCFDQVCQRIAALRPDDAARWGRMNAHQMICHLCDSAQVAMGEKEVTASGLGLPPWLLKKLALEVPVPWAKNVPTPPQIDQLREGTPPVEFERDRKEMLHRTRLLLDAPLEGRPHAYFGPLTQEEWMRWAWLHTDHHLRQFGR